MEDKKNTEGLIHPVLRPYVCVPPSPTLHQAHDHAIDIRLMTLVDRVHRFRSASREPEKFWFRAIKDPDATKELRQSDASKITHTMWHVTTYCDKKWDDIWDTGMDSTYTTAEMLKGLVLEINNAIADMGPEMLNTRVELITDQPI
jgi:hypothetical protein